MARNDMEDFTSGIEATSTQPSATIPRYMIVHRVECPGSTPDHSDHPHISLYLDVPRLFAGDNNASRLRGQMPDGEAQIRAKKDADISFIIHRTYNCLEYHTALFDALRETSVDSLPPHWSFRTYILPIDAFDAVAEREYMEISSTHLNEAIEAVKDADTRPESLDKSLLLGWKREHNMVAPYLHFYHTRKLLRDYSHQISERQREHINLLLGYLEENFGPDYQEAETLFDDGLVSRKHFHKLFGPREILVTVEEGHHIAMVSRYPPLAGSNPIRLECEMWKFNGRFAKYKKTIIIPWPKYAEEVETIPIKSLDFFPLKFDQRLKYRLRQRGKFCWQLRNPRLVLYTAPREVLDYRMENGRYMVDIETYRRFHKLSVIGNMTIEHAEEYLPLKATESDSPPAGSFTLLLPPTTYGFGLHDKKWRKLSIEYAAHIVWGEDTFNLTMFPQQVNDNLSALELNVKRSRDVKASRGQGRVIELHSGSKTARMVAAEALAESARKPLYQLAVHEVGVEPEQVENNIQEAFYLGGLWDAVILLEDCDRFIGPQREPTLAGRSIASIIYQAINSYHGVVVLTMNQPDRLDHGVLWHEVQTLGLYKAR